MIVIDTIDQLSPEWFEEKAGKPGASSFEKIVTTKGEPSKQQTDYMYQLAAETITGVKDDGYSNQAMEEGIAREDECRSLFELINDVEVHKVGLVYKDENKNILCSPDGLITNDGEYIEGFEMKNPLAKTHVKYLLDNRLPTKYFTQCQGSLYITNLEVWNFMSYYPGLKPLIIRVERDEKFIHKLGNEIERFLNKLNDVISKIR